MNCHLVHRHLKIIFIIKIVVVISSTNKVANIKCLCCGAMHYLMESTEDGSSSFASSCLQHIFISVWIWQLWCAEMMTLLNCYGTFYNKSFWPISFAFREMYVCTGLYQTMPWAYVFSNLVCVCVWVGRWVGVCKLVAPHHFHLLYCPLSFEFQWVANKFSFHGIKVHLTLHHLPLIQTPDVCITLSSNLLQPCQ